MTSKSFEELIKNHGQPNFMIGTGYVKKYVDKLEKEKKEYYQEARSANRNLARLTGIYERKCESFDKLEELLKEACKELHGSKLYDESIGVHTYCISEPEQQRWKCFKDFLNKPEIKKIMEKGDE